MEMPADVSVSGSEGVEQPFGENVSSPTSNVSNDHVSRKDSRRDKSYKAGAFSIGHSGDSDDTNRSSSIKASLSDSGPLPPPSSSSKAQSSFGIPSDIGSLNGMSDLSAPDASISPLDIAPKGKAKGDVNTHGVHRCLLGGGLGLIWWSYGRKEVSAWLWQSRSWHLQIQQLLTWEQRLDERAPFGHGARLLA